MSFDFASAALSRLTASAFGSLAPDEKVVDLFCGAGGWGDGLASVGIQTDFAINHDAVAIEYHQRNHPACVHHQGDAWRTKPRDVVGTAKVGLLLASAACTSHSRAKGAAPVSKRVHMLGTCILRWLKDTSPRLALVENVAEWMDWGPLIEKRDERGRLTRDKGGRILYAHDPARKGTKWRWWCRQARKLGYALDFRVLDAADFGNASRRKRLFVMLRRDGQPCIWPEVTHGASAGPRKSGAGAGKVVASGVESRSEGRRPAQSGQGNAGLEHAGQHAPRVFVGTKALHDTNGAQIKPHRSAASIINWTDLGCSIFASKAEQRAYKAETGVRVKRPLKPKSLARIAGGVLKHVLRKADPFVLRLTQTGPGSGLKVSSIDMPLPTCTTREDFAMAVPVIGVMAYGDGKDGTARWGRSSLPVTEPLGTLHAGGNNFGMISPLLAPCGGPKRQPESVAGAMGTVLTREDRGVAVPVLAYANHGEVQTGSPDEPMRTVVAGGHHAGLAVPLLGEYYGNGVFRSPADPLGCVVTKDRHGLASIVLDLTNPATRKRALQTARFLRKHLGDEVRLNAEGFAVCFVEGVERVIVDILFRMLRVPELAAAMGFGPERVWPKSSRDATKLIGNAVSPVQARALVQSLIPRGRGGEERREVAA